MKTKTKKSKTKKSLEGNYIASIKILGKVYKSTGATIKEAIENLQVGKVAKGVSVLTLERNGNMCSKVLPHSQTFRLFGTSRLIREVGVKQVVMRFPEL